MCNIAKNIYFTVQIWHCCLNLGGRVMRDWISPGRGQVLLRFRDCSSPPDPSVAFFLTSPLWKWTSGQQDKFLCCSMYHNTYYCLGCKGLKAVHYWSTTRQQTKEQGWLFVSSVLRDHGHSSYRKGWATISACSITHGTGLSPHPRQVSRRSYVLNTASAGFTCAG